MPSCLEEKSAQTIQEAEVLDINEMLANRPERNWLKIIAWLHVL
jgi:hypothetical protein